MDLKRAVVLGAGGFIGGHLTKRLQREGYGWVRAVDVKKHDYCDDIGDEFILADLCDVAAVRNVITEDISEVYQMASDVGGAEYVYTGRNDANIMHRSATINLNVILVCKEVGIKKVFFPSSACIYPGYNQMDPKHPVCNEESAYPAMPANEYGWEKLFAERLYQAFAQNYDIDVRIARLHNTYGPYSYLQGERAKAVLAICCKVAMAKDGNKVKIYGDGTQTRSFTYIDECIEGIMRLMNSDFKGPVNIGSEELVTIDELAQMVIEVSGKKLEICHVEGPVGVFGRNSDNKLILEKLDWKPAMALRDGVKKTYQWVDQQVQVKYNTD